MNGSRLLVPCDQQGPTVHEIRGIVLLGVTNLSSTSAVPDGDWKGVEAILTFVPLTIRSADRNGNFPSHWAFHLAWEHQHLHSEDCQLAARSTVLPAELAESAEW